MGSKGQRCSVASPSLPEQVLAYKMRLKVLPMQASVDQRTPFPANRRRASMTDSPE